MRGKTKEYLDPIPLRYLHSNREDKSRILDEAGWFTSRHRRALMGALRSQPGGRPRPCGLEDAGLSEYLVGCH